MNESNTIQNTKLFHLQANREQAYTRKATLKIKKKWKEERNHKTGKEFQ